MLLSTLTKAALGERLRHKPPASRMLGCIVVCLLLGLMPMQALAEYAAPSALDESGGALIPEHIIRKLMQDPGVAEANARTCQAIKQHWVQGRAANPKNHRRFLGKLWVLKQESSRKQRLKKMRPHPYLVQSHAVQYVLFGRQL
jgi:hypothetical protein